MVDYREILRLDKENTAKGKSRQARGFRVIP